MGALEVLRGLSHRDTLEYYRGALGRGDREELRWLCRNDRFFLLGAAMGRRDVLEKPWCLARCREVEAEPDGRLDLWSRFHYKSTIITLAGAVQEILRDPETTIGILSYSKPTAHRFVDQIRRALEDPRLAGLFPDVLWARPPRTNWSARDGLTVRRRGNPKEPTVSGSGLVDGQPVGMHYRLRIYDDVVTPASVTSAEQIEKTTRAWELSLALGTEDGGRSWYAGTRYHREDTYAEILRRGALRERRRICTGPGGEPLMMSEASLRRLRENMGAFTWAAQMMQDPVADGNALFRAEWWLSCPATPPRAQTRVALLVDSASAKKRGSDYTTMMAVAWAADRNWYLLDCVHDRMNLAERTEALFALQEEWRPEWTFWEQVGAMSDVEHVRGEMDRRGWHFRIEAIAQSVPKPDRIGWLQPEFEAGRVWVPPRILRRRADGRLGDAVEELRREFEAYPAVAHDDMLDCLANIKHPAVAARMRFPDRRGGAAAQARASAPGLGLGSSE